MWRIYTMSELYRLLNTEKSSVFIEPTFPTYRWGKTHTKTSSTDIVAINKGIVKLREQGITTRKRICYDDIKKYRNKGKFYRIEIKEN